MKPVNYRRRPVNSNTLGGELKMQNTDAMCQLGKEDDAMEEMDRLGREAKNKDKNQKVTNAKTTHF